MFDLLKLLGKIIINFPEFFIKSLVVLPFVLILGYISIKFKIKIYILVIIIAVLFFILAIIGVILKISEKKERQTFRQMSWEVKEGYEKSNVQFHQIIKGVVQKYQVIPSTDIVWNYLNVKAWNYGHSRNYSVDISSENHIRLQKQDKKIILKKEKSNILITLINVDVLPIFMDNR